MKNIISKLLLVTAVVVPTHVFAETYVDNSADSSRVIHYTQRTTPYQTAAYNSSIYDREGYVANDNTTIIQAMQQALRDAGFYKLGDVNGVWTQHTADALYSYQLANGLRGTARLDYPTSQRLGMALPAMDKTMEGSTRAPEANATTRHARSLSGRRVIQEPTVVVNEEYDSNGRLIARDVNGNRIERNDRPMMRNAEMNRMNYHRDYARLDTSKVQDVQQTLADAGFYKGGVDGVWGPATSKALRSYQASNGLKATGKLNGPTLDKLGMVESENDVSPASGR
ncbi:MAG: Peptidoglycan-binding domain 1 protein [Micavibrio sp.]|nr:Peptidoglycan-binding domain 1 protein [Micavibrio sp.]